MRARIAKKKLRALSELYHDPASSFPHWIELHFGALFILALDQDKAQGYWGKRPTTYNSAAMGLREWSGQKWWELMDAHMGNGRLGCYKALWRIARHELFGAGRRRQSCLLWITSPAAEKPVPVCVKQRGLGVYDIAQALGKTPDETRGLYCHEHHEEGGASWRFLDTRASNRFVHDGDLLVLAAMPETMPKVIDVKDLKPCS